MNIRPAASPTFDPDGLTPHARANGDSWNGDSAEYQADHGPQLAASGGLAWGVWQVPEAELRILGDVQGKDILELGSTPMAQLCYPDEGDYPIASLQRDYFGMRALRRVDPAVPRERLRDRRSRRDPPLRGRDQQLLRRCLS